MTNVQKILDNSSLDVLSNFANLVGYVRVGILIILLFSFFNYPVFSVTLYVTSLLLDGVDGYLARRLNQQSHFGAILDMVTDRISVALLLVVLSIMYPDLFVFFTFLLLLDLASHMAIIYSTAIVGKTHSHKDTLMRAHRFLRIYYDNPIVLGGLCLSHDIFLCLLYMYHFFPGFWLLALICIFLIGCLFKTYIHLIQFYFSMKNVL